MFTYCATAGINLFCSAPALGGLGPMFKSIRDAKKFFCFFPLVLRKKVADDHTILLALPLVKTSTGVYRTVLRFLYNPVKWPQ